MPFEPFLRWAGGKTWLVAHLNSIIGTTQVRHYHEPFLGGGAIFFNTEHKLRSYLSDSNEDLVNAFICVRDMPEPVIRIIQTFRNTAEDYYRVRALALEDKVEQAARG